MDKSVPDGFKQCNGCGLVKLTSEFPTIKRPNNVIGLKYLCKTCDNAASSERTRRRKERQGKKCAYPGCDIVISSQATYCKSHGYEYRSSKLPKVPSKSICAHPGCGKVLSHRTSEYCLEHYLSPEYPARRRKTYSPATRAKMSASAKRRVNTPAGKANISRAASIAGKASKGRRHTPATKAKIREKRALQVISRESMEKAWSKARGRPSKNKGGTQTPATKAKISAKLQAQRDHLSQVAKERYANETEEQREKRLNRWIQAGQEQISKMLSGTSIELFLAQHLDTLGIEYETQKRISYYIVDFCIPSRMIVIEAMGCYWHGCSLCGFNKPEHILRRERDKIRTERLMKQGYVVISIWEHDIRKAMQDSTYALQLNL